MLNFSCNLMAQLDCNVIFVRSSLVEIGLPLGFILTEHRPTVISDWTMKIISILTNQQQFCRVVSECRTKCQCWKMSYK